MASPEFLKTWIKQTKKVTVGLPNRYCCCSLYYCSVGLTPAGQQSKQKQRDSGPAAALVVSGSTQCSVRQ